GEQRRRMLQAGEAEERRDWYAGGHMYGAGAHLDFLLGQIEIACIGISRQVFVRPGVAADRHSGFDHLLGDLGMRDRVLADLEECGFQTIISERLENRWSVFRPGAVVESQHDLLIAEEVVLLEMLEAESGAALRVDLYDAHQSHATRFVAGGDVAGRDAARARSGRTLWGRVLDDAR